MSDTPTHRQPPATAPPPYPCPRLIAFDPAVEFNGSYPARCRTADKIWFVVWHMPEECEYFASKL